MLRFLGGTLVVLANLIWIACLVVWIGRQVDLYCKRKGW
jgi:hypothetical protein